MALKFPGAGQDMLPDSQFFITSIIHELSKHSSTLPTPGPINSEHGAPSSSLLSSLSAYQLSKIKPLLLTLHFFFPGELLLALDILDRRLVTKLMTTSSPTDIKTGEQGTRSDDDHNKSACAQDEIYLVQSVGSMTAGRSSLTSSAKSKSSANMGKKSYIVCLNSWNCTCPTFTMAMFRDSNSWCSQDGDNPASSKAFQASVSGSHDNTGIRGLLSGMSEGDTLIFGGTMVDKDYGTPVCKHILACVLGSRCPSLFVGGIENAYVGENEMAGYQAGWVG